VDACVATLLGLAALTAVAAVASTGWRSLPVAALIAALCVTTVVGVLLLGYVELSVLGSRLLRLVRMFRHRGHTLVRIAEASRHVREAAAWPDLRRRLQGLVEAGVLEEVSIERRDGGGAAEPNAWVLKARIGGEGYVLVARAAADGTSNVRPEDIRQYLVPALEHTMGRFDRDRIGKTGSAEGLG
jgi:hypothetical protein